MDEFDAYIEMVAGSNIKHVFDEKQGKLMVHRKTALPLPDPFNYGFIKGTTSGDGDPIDVFVISSRKLALGSTIKIRPIGMLYVVDEMGEDNKVIAIDALDESLNGIDDIDKVDAKLMQTAKYLLEHNKDDIEGKWTKVNGSAGMRETIIEIKKILY
ncbi:MAG: inorganic diphosphatase [Candidatus Micrarchaeaceae archaeon]